MTRTFSFAPMDRMFGILTAALFGIPALFVVLALVFPESRVLGGVAVLLLVLYAAVWVLFRPQRFELSPSQLVIRWQLRRQVIDRTDIRSARVVSKNDLRGLLGLAVRIGAGGLFGVYGWLWSPRRGLVTIYTSRADQLVALERTNGKLMLLSPADPKAFVSALSS